jgi:O-antigen ligase
MLLLAAVLVYIFREGSLFICVAFSVAIIFFMLLKWNKTLLVLVICVAALPLLPIFNNGIFRGLANIFEHEAYRTEIWNAVFNMLTRYGLTGIGSSNEAFTTLYSSYYVGNTVNVPHAHSTLLQLTITLGFLGLILFALIIMFLVQSTFSYARNSIDKTSSNKTLCFSGICAVLAMVLTGIGENVLRDPRAALVFWLLCGLTVCARRSAKDISAIDEILAEIDAYYYG